MKDIIFEIKKRFNFKLQRKTGWGKIEVEQLLDQVIIEVLAEELDKHKDSFD